ncbi:MAG: universal stress protein [Idiomarina sp.]|nr:universal stress protein [Idiomarina sp.]
MRKVILEELIEESGINPEQGVVIHHKRGVVDVLVPLMIKSLDIDTLVMGTLARTGFSGMLIGNTAENLLQKVSCSVLAFKPEAFRSPLDKRV